MARKERKNQAKRRIPTNRANDSSVAFEKAFQKRLGQTPVEWVRSKVEAGSQVKDIQYLFEISAAEIARQNKYMPQPFDVYYSIYLKSGEVIPMPERSAKIYNKLVRDRIPEIIQASGKTCSFEILTGEKYIEMLDAKLNEELAEYQESKSLAELADLLEVMGAVVKARGYTWEELTAIRKKKREAHGGFEKRILLREVTP